MYFTNILKTCCDVVNTQIVVLFEENKLFTNQQFGNQKRRKIEDAISYLCSKVIQIYEIRKFVEVLFHNYQLYIA